MKKNAENLPTDYLRMKKLTFQMRPFVKAIFES